MKKSKLVPMILIGDQIKIGSSDKMPVVGGCYIRPDIIPVVCIFNNSAELSLDDNKSINKAMRSFYEILREKSGRSRFCEARISVIGLSGENLKIADNCEMIHFFWDDRKPEGRARWGEAIKHLDDQLFEYMRHLQFSSMIYRPVVLLFTTSDSIPSLSSFNLEKYASIKNIVTTFMVTPETDLEDYESLKKIIRCENNVVNTCEIDHLKELVVFSKIKNPFIDSELLQPLDDARFLIRCCSDTIDVVEAFSLTYVKLNRVN